MKHKQGSMKYDIEDIEELDEFGNEDESIILNDKGSKCISKYKGVGSIGVSLRKGESIDSLLKRFKKNVMESNIMTEYSESRVFVKPSVVRRQKKINRKFKAKLAEKNKY